MMPTTINSDPTVEPVVPDGFLRLLEPGERPLIAISGVPRTILATDRRVIIGIPEASAMARSFAYRDLTGVVANLGIISRRQIALTGPGLRTGAWNSALDGSSTTIHIWKLGPARAAAKALQALILEKNGAAAQG